MALWSTLVVGFMGLPARGNDLQPPQESIRSLIQRGSYDLALRRLSEDQAPADLFSHHFQKAYCLQQLEHWDEAASLYEELLETSSPLKDYLRLFLAICYARSNHGERAEGQLLRLLEKQDHLLVDEARQMLGDVYLELEKADDAIQTFQLLTRSPALESQLPEFLFSMGQAHLQAGRADEAALLFGQILSRYPASSAAPGALEELMAIRGGPLSDGELFDAAWVHFHHRRYREAAQEWGRFVQLYPHHQQASEALYLSARASYRDKRYSQAEAQCRRLLEVYPQSRRVTSAHYLVARCAEEDGKITLAAKRYGQFVRDYPWSQLADDVLWRMARLHEREGDFPAAQQEYLTLSQQYASRERAVQALWRAGLYAFLLEDNAVAIALFNRLRTRYPQSHLVVGSLYWTARAHLRSGKGVFARQLLEQVVRLDVDGYYAQRATARLEQDLIPSGVPRSPSLEELLNEDLEKYPALDQAVAGHYQRGKALLRMGLLTRARGELSQVHLVAHQRPRLLVDLLRLYEKFQLYGDALLLAQSVKENLDHPEWSVNLERFLYPLSYLETVTAEAVKYGLEPHFVLSVIRVESRFDPLAISSAGARGLMQIMPVTGKEIEEQLGLSANPFCDLYRPELNIRLGTYYLWRQLEEFGGRPEMALAAYNAGPGRVRGWLRRLGAVDPELFVELIEFPETRQFVKKVLVAQACYGRIWGVQG